MPSAPWTKYLRSVAWIPLFGLCLPSLCDAQHVEARATDLLKYLTYQSGRPGKVERETLFDCAASDVTIREDRTAAAALVKLGPTAIPEIETALNSLMASGEESPSRSTGPGC